MEDILLKFNKFKCICMGSVHARSLAMANGVSQERWSSKNGLDMLKIQVLPGMCGLSRPVV